MCTSAKHNATIPNEIRFKEILGIVHASALPMADDHMMGVINFRGKTVPVIDLRVNTIAGLGGYAEHICILSAEENDQHGNPVIFGALVDSEADAYELISGNTH